MTYTIVVVPGIPLYKEATDLEKEMLYNVPCPCCLKPMLLSGDQLKTIFIHYFIENSNEQMDSMCYNCIQNEENNRINDKHNPIKVFSHPVFDF